MSFLLRLTLQFACRLQDFIKLHLKTQRTTEPRKSSPQLHTEAEGGPNLLHSHSCTQITKEYAEFEFGAANVLRAFFPRQRSAALRMIDQSCATLSVPFRYTINQPVISKNFQPATLQPHTQEGPGWKLHLGCAFDIVFCFVSTHVSQMTSLDVYDPEQVKMMEEEVILVDGQDNVLGKASKKECTLVDFTT